MVLKTFWKTNSSNSITKYITFYKIIKEKDAKYPFAIFNTGRKSKPGTQWWCFLDIYPKKDLLLRRFTGFKKFIIDDLGVIDKLFNLQKFTIKKFKSKLYFVNFFHLFIPKEKYLKK